MVFGAFSLCALSAIIFIIKIIPAKISAEKATELFNQAGGAAKINQEAKLLFAQFESVTNGTKFLHEPELKNFPAISALGNHVFLTRDSPDDPPMIGILAAHTPNQWFYIFPGDFELDKIAKFQNMPDFKMALSDNSISLRIVSNIFFQK